MVSTAFAGLEVTKSCVRTGGMRCLGSQVWYSLGRHTLHGRQDRSLPSVSPKHSSSIHRTGGA